MLSHSTILYIPLRSDKTLTSPTIFQPRCSLYIPLRSDKTSVWIVQERNKNYWLYIPLRSDKTRSWDRKQQSISCLYIPLRSDKTHRLRYARRDSKNFISHSVQIKQKTPFHPLRRPRLYIPLRSDKTSRYDRQRPWPVSSLYIPLRSDKTQYLRMTKKLYEQSLYPTPFR